MCDGRENLVNAKVCGSEDRISQLPDDLLTQILSFLPTETVIRSSALSTRWSHLWTTVPNLELNVSEFLPRGEGVNRITRSVNLQAFVIQFLMQNTPCFIKTLHLDCLAENLPISRIKLVWSKLDPLDIENHPHYPMDLFHIVRYDLEAWIHLAKIFKVNELSISCDEYTQSYLEVCLNSYKFENLVCLKLSGDIPFDIPEASISFPKLKTLLLEDIILKDEYSLSNLINSCCPILENLYVYSNEIYTDLGGLDITIRTLKKLEIDIFRCDEFIIAEITIKVPSLEYLSLQNVITLKNDVAEASLGTLVEADLDIYIDAFNSFISSEDHLIRLHHLFQLLRRVCNVKKLTLSETTWVPLDDNRVLPTFCNLTHLEIKDSGDDGFSFSWELLVNILKNSPKLENLCLVGLVFDMQNEVEEDDIPKCLTRCLKTLEISSIDGKKEELENLGYFLEHSKVLEKMKVTIGKRYSRRRKIKNKIFKLAKGSPECEIVVIYTS